MNALLKEKKKEIKERRQKINFSRQKIQDLMLCT